MKVKSFNRKSIYNISQRNGTPRFPDFVIIGAAKSGTTTLYRYLCRHPQVYMPEVKEPLFFSDDSVYSLGAEWYQSLFAEARKDQICGEASTGYSRWPCIPEVPKRIAQVMHDVKFIYIMRHPVDRTYSHFEHLIVRAGLTATFDEALESTEILDTSMYMQQIEQYLRFFPRESIMFILLDDLDGEPAGILRQVQCFLGIREVDLTAGGPIVANKGKADFFIRKQTTQRLRAIPGGSQLADRLPKSWRDYINRRVIRSPLGKRLRNQYGEQFVLTSATRTRLLKIFEEPNRQLAAFLDRDLSHWSQ